MYLPWNGAITFGSSERWKDKRHKTRNTCFALTLTKLGFYSRKGTWGFSLSITFTAFSSLTSCKLYIPQKLFISNTNSHSTLGPPVVGPIMRGTWAFGLFLTWYFGICQFFLWYCDIWYPKMPPQVKPCQAGLETGWVTCRRYDFLLLALTSIQYFRIPFFQFFQFKAKMWKRHFFQTYLATGSLRNDQQSHSILPTPLERPQ